MFGAFTKPSTVGTGNDTREVALAPCRRRPTEFLLLVQRRSGALCSRKEVGKCRDNDPEQHCHYERTEKRQAKDQYEHERHHWKIYGVYPITDLWFEENQSEVRGNSGEHRGGDAVPQGDVSTWHRESERHKPNQASARDSHQILNDELHVDSCTGYRQELRRPEKQ
jgi:hypothetical protein